MSLFKMCSCKNETKDNTVFQEIKVHNEAPATTEAATAPITQSPTSKTDGKKKSWANDFKGKVVIVTGGGRGIGKGLCIELSKLGAKVYAVARSPENLKSLRDEYPTIQTVAVDLSDWKATREAIEKIETADMLVNNAGISLNGDFFEATEKEYDDQAAVNLKSVVNVSQVVAKKMIDSKRPGNIVNVSSLAGLAAFGKSCCYSVLKASLNHLTRIMAMELGPSNIRVNAVNPGPVNTDMFAKFQSEMANLSQEELAIFAALSQRTLTPQKVAEVPDVVNSILFLLSNSSKMTTGTCLTVEGGFHIS